MVRVGGKSFCCSMMSMPAVKERAVGAEEEDAERFLVAEVVDGLENYVTHGDAHRVALLGAIERQDDDPVSVLAQDVVAHQAPRAPIS
jgi:hypothetical protein